MECARVRGSLAALRIGMDVLAAEDVHVQQMLAHGGVFTTPLVA